MSWELYGDEKTQLQLEIDILRDSSQEKNCVLKGALFKGLVSKRYPDALLTKTIIVPVYAVTVVL